MKNLTENAWWYDEHGQTVFCNINDGHGEYMIANVRGIGADLDINAHGKLIAAAPEMLNACKAAKLELITVNLHTNLVSKRVINQLEQAIKKAEEV